MVKKKQRFKKVSFVGEGEKDLSELVLDEVVKRINLKKGYHCISYKEPPNDTK